MSNDLTILEGSVKLSDALVIMLDAHPGDKLSIDYISHNNKLVPMIHKTDTGKKLSKQNTFLLKGKERDLLLQYGDSFTVEDDLGDFLLKGDRPFVVYTNNSKVEIDYLPKDILEDTNYNIEKFKKFEL